MAPTAAQSHAEGAHAVAGGVLPGEVQEEASDQEQAQHDRRGHAQALVHRAHHGGHLTLEGLALIYKLNAGRADN